MSDIKYTVLEDCGDTVVVAFKDSLARWVVWRFPKIKIDPPALPESVETTEELTA